MLGIILGLALSVPQDPFVSHVPRWQTCDRNVVAWANHCNLLQVAITEAHLPGWGWHNQERRLSSLRQQMADGKAAKEAWRLMGMIGYTSWDPCDKPNRGRLILQLIDLIGEDNWRMQRWPPVPMDN